MYSTAKVHKIAELKTKKDAFKEAAECMTIPEAKHDPYFLDAVDEIDLQIKTIYKNLIEERLTKEQDEQNLLMLQAAQTKLLSGKKLLLSEQRTLLEYLYSVYDRASEIYQTKKWMSDFAQNDGFGVTCGIISFKPESLEQKTPIDIIEKAGKVLKKGKYTKKGQVYLEDIK